LVAPKVDKNISGLYNECKRDVQGRLAMQTDRDRLTYDVLEAARKLGISRNLAYDMARDGRLPTIKLGKRLLIPKKALERMLEGANTAGPIGE